MKQGPPWRFQGRIRESASSATDLYDFQARSYDPSLGAFTGFDSVTGSAQNPLTLNRYLYTAANPATLVDPDGHKTKTHIQADRREAWRERLKRESCAAWVYEGSGMQCLTYSQKTANKVRQEVHADAVAAAQYYDEESYYEQEGAYYSSYAALDRIEAEQTMALGHQFGGDSTAAEMWDSTHVANISKPRDCGFAGLGCSIVGDALNTVNQGWQATGGAAVDWGVKHPLAVLAGAGVITACAIPGVDILSCPLVLAGAGSGVGAYTLGNGVNNIKESKGFFSGWDLGDAGTDAFAGELTFVTGGAFDKVFTGAADLALLTGPARTIAYGGWMTFAGGVGALESLAVNHLAGKTSATGDLCSVVSSFVPGEPLLGKASTGAASLASIACGGLGG